MSKQQQVELDARLRQGAFDPRGEVTDLRVRLRGLDAKLPVPDDVRKTTTAVWWSRRS